MRLQTRRGKPYLLLAIETMRIKENLSLRYLAGYGVEFGPLNNPLPVDEDKARVIYADRLSKSNALAIFPELIDLAAGIIDPDLIVDFNDPQRLRSLRSHNFNFLIANHFIEHLANPTQFLEGCSETLTTGGLLFLTVPNKEHTFDKRRKLTSNEHLWQDYQNGESIISKAHLRDFLLNKEAVSSPHPEVVKYFYKHGLPLSYYNGNKLPLNPLKRKRLYDFHRERSIHVHVWNRESFDNFLTWTIEKLNLRFEILETHLPEDVEEEMIYVIEKIAR